MKKVLFFFCLCTFSALINPQYITAQNYYSVTFNINCCGEPLEGIMISIGGNTYVTGVNGQFVVNLPEGSYSVWIGGYLFNFTLPGTDYIDANICRELTYQVTDEQGNPLAGVFISMDPNMLVTNSGGEADTCLQVGSYSYSASKPGFVTQTGTFEMDTIPQTLEVVMPAQTWSLTFHLIGPDCENDFEGLIIIINGDTLLTGESIDLSDGSYDWTVVLLGCGMLADGMVTINGAPVTVELIGPDLPKVTFHVTDQFGADFPYAPVCVDDDILIADNSGIASFCLTGGFHPYWVANPGYDTIFENLIFNCADTTINVILITGSISTEKPFHFNVYPNPSTGKFYLELPNPVTGSIEIQVMDLTGRRVYEVKDIVTGKTEIDLLDQPKGMYFVRVKSGEGLLTQKIVIQ